MLSSSIVLSSILLAILAVNVYKKNISSSSYAYLLFYLCTNFVFEASVLWLITRLKGNVWIYNLEMIFEVTFFLLLYKKEFADNNYKKRMMLAAAMFIAFALFNMLVYQSFFIFNSNTYTLGSFMLIFTCCFFLYSNIIKNENQNPLFSLMFWISMGILFCYLGNFPFLSNVNELFAISKPMTLKLRVISLSVNVLLYLLITVGVICNRKV